MSRKYASTSAQNAKNMSFLFNHQARVLQDRLARCGGGDRTRRPGIPEWKKVYLKESAERKLLHQARVLGWGKEKRHYYACKITYSGPKAMTANAEEFGIHSRPLTRVAVTQSDPVVTRGTPESSH